MTIGQARKLKWGTVLRPSPRQRQQFRKRAIRNSIYLGVTRDKHNIKVVSFGTKTAETWSPIFWTVKPEVMKH